MAPHENARGVVAFETASKALDLAQKYHIKPAIVQRRSGVRNARFERALLLINSVRRSAL
jgi:hypothetical protein